MLAKRRTCFIGIGISILIAAVFIFSAYRVNASDVSAGYQAELEKTYYTQAVSFKGKISSYDIIDEDGLAKSKRYRCIQELERQINFAFLHSPYFSEQNATCIYVSSPGFSDIYQIPKSPLKKTASGDAYAFFNEINDQPFLCMTVRTDAKQENVPREYIGLYRVQKPFFTKSGTKVSLIEEDFGKRYIIVFRHNDVVYTVENISSISMAEKIANSFYQGAVPLTKAEE